MCYKYLYTTKAKQQKKILAKNKLQVFRSGTDESIYKFMYTYRKVSLPLAKLKSMNVSSSTTQDYRSPSITFTHTLYAL